MRLATILLAVFLMAACSREPDVPQSNRGSGCSINTTHTPANTGLPTDGSDPAKAQGIPAIRASFEVMHSEKGSRRAVKLAKGFGSLWLLTGSHVGLGGALRLDGDKFVNIKEGYLTPHTVAPVGSGNGIELEDIVTRFNTTVDGVAESAVFDPLAEELITLKLNGENGPEPFRNSEHRRFYDYDLSDHLWRECTRNEKGDESTVAIWREKDGLLTELLKLSGIRVDDGQLGLRSRFYREMLGSYLFYDGNGKGFLVGKSGAKSITLRPPKTNPEFPEFAGMNENGLVLASYASHDTLWIESETGSEFVTHEGQPLKHSRIFVCECGSSTYLFGMDLPDYAGRVYSLNGSKATEIRAPSGARLGNFQLFQSGELLYVMSSTNMASGWRRTHFFMKEGELTPVMTPERKPLTANSSGPEEHDYRTQYLYFRMFPIPAFQADSGHIWMLDYYDQRVRYLALAGASSRAVTISTPDTQFSRGSNRFRRDIAFWGESAVIRTRSSDNNYRLEWIGEDLVGRLILDAPNHSLESNEMQFVIWSGYLYVLIENIGTYESSVLRAKLPLRG